MDLVDVKNVSPAMFAAGAVLILWITSFLSLGVLRLFQLKRRQAFLFLVLGVLGLAALIWSANTWMAE